jgi:sugar/nucleoside kinase (ribokinase family)
MPEPVDVLVIGDVLTDVLVRPVAARAAGSDTPARIEEHPGGQGANQAAWLAAEGTRVGLVARVAEAERAAQEAALHHARIVPFLAGDPTQATGRIVVLVDPTTGERDMFSDRAAAAALTPDDVTSGLAATRRWVHLSGYAAFGDHGGEVVAAAITAARQRGLGVSVDPASTSELRRFGVRRFRDLVAGVDLLLPNLEEACLLSGQDTAQTAAVALRSMARSVVITCGARGAVAAHWSGELVEMPAGSSAVVDTTGAGDAFTAGFLAGHLAGDDEMGSLRRALAASARAVGFLGARPPS